VNYDIDGVAVNIPLEVIVRLYESSKHLYGKTFPTESWEDYLTEEIFWHGDKPLEIK
jgi:hypothetical protein